MPSKAGLNRAAVISAAAQLLDCAESPELTMGNLAAHLGVRTPSLYNHISGIADLQFEIALFGTQELGRRIARAAIGKSGDAALLAIAGAYRGFAKEKPGLYRATLRAPSADENARMKVSDEIIDVLRVVLEPFQLSDQRVIHVIRGFRSVLHGFVSLELAGGFGIPLNVNQSFDDLIRMFISGLHQQDWS